MTRCVCASALALLVASSAHAAPGTAVSTVNLRAEANTASAILAKIPAGTRVDVGDCTAGWCAVTWADKSGFIIQTALDMSGRAVVRAPRRGPPGIGPGAEYVPVGPRPPGYVVAPGPAVVYAPGPYYYGGPYWGPYWGPRWGWRRW